MFIQNNKSLKKRYKHCFELQGDSINICFLCTLIDNVWLNFIISTCSCSIYKLWVNKLIYLIFPDSSKIFRIERFTFLYLKTTLPKHSPYNQLNFFLWRSSDTYEQPGSEWNHSLYEVPLSQITALDVVNLRSYEALKTLTASNGVYASRSAIPIFHLLLPTVIYVALCKSE